MLQGQLSAHKRTIQSNILCSLPRIMSYLQSIMQNSTDNASFPLPSIVWSRNGQYHPRRSKIFVAIDLFGQPTIEAKNLFCEPTYSCTVWPLSLTDITNRILEKKITQQILHCLLHPQPPSVVGYPKALYVALFFYLSNISFHWFTIVTEINLYL